MRPGFFSSSVLMQSKSPPSLIAKCGACGLYKKCQSPKMPVSGKGKRKILIVGDSPGTTDDQLGRHFTGEAGQSLETITRRTGLSLRDDCWMTNAIICHPTGSRDPKENEVRFCRPNLMKTIKELNPEVIILLGSAAVQSLIGAIWKEKVGSITRWAGWQIPSQKLNTWICPSYSPLDILRMKRNQQATASLILSQHVERAVALSEVGRPWDEDSPNFDTRVERVFKAAKAAKIIRKMIQKGGRVAFDYETNMLKPDSKKARIVCCSVCWEGKKTIAYPWHGEAIKATSELLLSERVKKIGANIKFEDRWTRAQLGHGIRGWIWCTVNGAHWEDSRTGITSVKFQSFVRMGHESYDDHIKPYLKSKKAGGNSPNRIDEVDLNDLLLYCGLDSLIEFKLAMIQRGEK